MNQQPISGSIYDAVFVRHTKQGVFVSAADQEFLLPEAEITGPVGKDVRIFVYETKAGKLQATMNIPSITTEAYDWAYVVSSIDAGVFVHIGLEKDILVSKDDLPEDKTRWPAKGDKLFVCLGHDRMGRLKALPVYEAVIDAERDKADRKWYGTTVKGHVYSIKEAGCAMVTEEGVRAFIHDSQLVFDPRLGQLLEARVIDVKEDGTINVTLRDERTAAQAKDAEKIMEILEERGGKMPFTDKSTPAEIEAAFGMSKAAFKRGLGKLMKEERIRQMPGVTEKRSDS
ncbi:CvfB family protein [Alkalicoccus luteus]|uniref:S1 motif domain-containing protein n=1 Tax=Alkalicoccus luteus TaxID=1237094 RepID=A0A969TUE9_9BACI|nr:S1-like domain-containing RNA-binding protein [Alkalicoccus luteus]NJP37270.1 hypothetical protein [Alkalicoccus luteus]